MSTLFISDLHLSGERPGITRLFIEFLQSRASDAEALYILGDLFEVWLGDDMVLAEYEPALDAMQQLSQQVPLYVMHGNRDFLMRDEFCRRSGATLLKEPATINLYGTPTMLLHGDTLCTDDLPYQQFRRMVRDPGWQEELLSKSPEERLALARKYREISKTETGHKAEAIMDVNPETVAQTLRDHNLLQVIHGHTHRPAIHDFELDGQPARRIVLGDWYDQGCVLVCDKSGCQLERLSL